MKEHLHKDKPSHQSLSVFFTGHALFITSSLCGMFVVKICLKKNKKKKTDMQNKAKHPKNLNQEHGCRTGNRVHHCTECKQQSSRDKESDTKRFPLLKNCD